MPKEKQLEGDGEQKRGGLWNQGLRFRLPFYRAVKKGLTDGKPIKTGRRQRDGVFGWIWGNFKRVDLEAEAGNPLENSAISALVRWILRNWAQAEPTVFRGEESDTQHPLAVLMRQPSAQMSGRLFMRSMLRDFYGLGKGSAFAFIVLGSDGKPIELQWLPARSVKPIADEFEGIAYYEVGKEKLKVPPARMIHFREACDAERPELGVDPLGPVYPEIATDNRAKIYQFGILKKGGVPPWIIGPKGTEDGTVAELDEEDAEFIKNQANEIVNGDIPGAGMVMPAGYQFDKIAFNPSEMVIGETQRKGEERMSGQVGLPPVVAGLGAGLDRSTFNNYKEARQAGWEDCVIPLQDDFAEEVNSKVMPFYKDGASVRFGYDRSRVRCLQDDEDAKFERWGKAFQRGGISRAEYQRRIDLQPTAEDEKFYATPGAAPDPAGSGTGGTGSGGGKTGKGEQREGDLRRYATR